MKFDKIIEIQRENADGEWERWERLHARVNKTGGGQNADSGAKRSEISLTFEVRWFGRLFEIFKNTQFFRIMYNNAYFYVEDYDDYMESHRTVRLEGVCSGERQDIAQRA